MLRRCRPRRRPRSRRRRCRRARCRSFAARASAPPPTVVFEVLTIPQPASRPGTAERRQAPARRRRRRRRRRRAGRARRRGGRRAGAHEDAVAAGAARAAHLQLRFAAPAVGRTMRSFRFEVMGVGEGKNAAAIQGSGLCAEPSISADYRNVFSRKVKVREPLRVRRQYVIARGTFEFGPLLSKRPQAAAAEDGTKPPPHPEHAELLHITNNGLFPLTVTFAFAHGGKSKHSHLPIPGQPPSRRRRRPSPARAAARAAARRARRPSPARRRPPRRRTRARRGRLPTRSSSCRRRRSRWRRRRRRSSSSRRSPIWTDSSRRSSCAR